MTENQTSSFIKYFGHMVIVLLSFLEFADMFNVPKSTAHGIVNQITCRVCSICQLITLGCQMWMKNK